MNKKNIDYLLKYISNNTYKKILREKSSILLDQVSDKRIDVDLNIRYLKKYGIKNIDLVVYERLNELIMTHNNFIDMIKGYEKNLPKEGVIMIFDNV